MPLLLPLLTFRAFLRGGGTLDPGLLFSSLAVLDLFRVPMRLLPEALQSIVRGRVGLRWVDPGRACVLARRLGSASHDLCWVEDVWDSSRPFTGAGV